MFAVCLNTIRWVLVQWIRHITKGATVEKTGEMKERPYSYNRVSLFTNKYVYNMNIISVLVMWLFLQSVGSFDISSIPECKGQAPKTAELPTYVNTQQIDAQVLAALQAEAENVTRDMAAAAKESSQKDLFDMSKSGLHILFVRRLKQRACRQSNISFSIFLHIIDFLVSHVWSRGTAVSSLCRNTARIFYLFSNSSS